MIVISSSLVLSEIDIGIPEGTPWIGYDNIVTEANIAASTEDASYPVSNLANPATHLLWKGTENTGDEYITIATALNDIDYLGVARHNFGTLGRVLSIEGSTGDSPLWFELVQEQMLPDDTPVLFRWELQSLTGVRLRIQPGSGIPQAAVVYVGRLLVLERGIKIDADHVPVKFGRRANIVSGMSEEGHFLGRVVVGEYRESKAQFTWFTPDWYRAYLDPFIIVSKELPFFFAWNPSEYPAEVGYCWMTNNPEPGVDPVTRRIAIDLQMRGVA